MENDCVHCPIRKLKPMPIRVRPIDYKYIESK